MWQHYWTIGTKVKIKGIIGVRFLIGMCRIVDVPNAVIYFSSDAEKTLCAEELRNFPNIIIFP